jgi:hypothetical protein
MSFRGMSANLGKYNDQIASMFRGAGSGDLAAWASKTFGFTQAEDKSWVPNSFYAGGSSPMGSGKIELAVAPGADSALSSMLMNLVRTGQLQLQKAGIR